MLRARRRSKPKRTWRMWKMESRQLNIKFQMLRRKAHPLTPYRCLKMIAHPLTPYRYLKTIAHPLTLYRCLKTIAHPLTSYPCLKTINETFLHAYVKWSNGNRKRKSYQYRVVCERSEAYIAPSLFFIRYHVNYALRKRWCWAHYGSAAGYSLWINPECRNKMIDAQLHLANNLMFITYRYIPSPFYPILRLANIYK